MFSLFEVIFKLQSSLIGIFSRRLDIFFEKKKDPFTRNDYDFYFSELKNFNELKILIIGLGNIGSYLYKYLNDNKNYSIYYLNLFSLIMI